MFQHLQVGASQSNIVLDTHCQTRGLTDSSVGTGSSNEVEDNNLCLKIASSRSPLSSVPGINSKFNSGGFNQNSKGIVMHEYGQRNLQANVPPVSPITQFLCSASKSTTAPALSGVKRDSFGSPRILKSVNLAPNLNADNIANSKGHFSSLNSSIIGQTNSFVGSPDFRHATAYASTGSSAGFTSNLDNRFPEYSVAPLSGRQQSDKTPVYCGEPSPFKPTKSHHNLSDFVTPEATIKMIRVSTDFAPSIENRNLSDAWFSARKLDTIKAADLDSTAFDDDLNGSSFPKKMCFLGDFLASHFSMGLKFPALGPVSSKSFFAWLSESSNNDIESNWIMHNIPRALKVSGIDLKVQLVLNKHITQELFDMSMRRMIQLDEAIYPSNLQLRWRHLLESDYAIHALRHSNAIENKAIREQFVGPQVHYEIPRCRMFFVPMTASGTWWCYSWDLKSSVVFIIDPSAADTKDDVLINKHIATIHQLSKSLGCIISDLFDGWSPNFYATNCVVLRLPGMPFSSQTSGLITLFSIWNFDGNHVTVVPNEDNIANFKAFLLDQLMRMKQNTGQAPSTVVKFFG